jgi:hypothetical protein
MTKNKSNLKEINENKSIQVLNIASSIAIKGGDDKRPPRPIGSGPIILPNGSVVQDGYDVSYAM